MKFQKVHAVFGPTYTEMRLPPPVSIADAVAFPRAEMTTPSACIAVLSPPLPSRFRCLWALVANFITPSSNRPVICPQYRESRQRYLCVHLVLQRGEVPLFLLNIVPTRKRKEERPQPLSWSFSKRAPDGKTSSAIKPVGPSSKVVSISAASV